jgi:hypothetical protein
MAKKKKLKKFQVVIESICRTTVEVEAEDDLQAADLAMQGEYGDPIDVDHDDSEVTQVVEVK